MDARQVIILAGWLSIATIVSGDWPQWRGGAQRASLAAGAKLVEAWRSEALPEGYGEQRSQLVGQGSPVIHAGKVDLYVNWPTEKKQFPDQGRLGRAAGVAARGRVDVD